MMGDISVLAWDGSTTDIEDMEHEGSEYDLGKNLFDDPDLPPLHHTLDYRQDVILKHYEGSMHVAFIDDQGRDVHIITHDHEDTSMSYDVDKEMTWYIPATIDLMCDGDNKEESKAYVDHKTWDDEWEQSKQFWFMNTTTMAATSSHDLLSRIEVEEDISQMVETPKQKGAIEEKEGKEEDNEERDEGSDLVTVETSKVFESLMPLMNRNDDGNVISTITDTRFHLYDIDRILEESSSTHETTMMMTTTKTENHGLFQIVFVRRLFFSS
jgi:hypothetical protein